MKFLVAAQLSQDVTNADLRKTLESHWDVKKNKLVQSVRFRNILQQSGESITQFVLRLKQGSVNCEYGAFLDRMLIEQMLHELIERDICDEVIAKNPVTFKEALDIVLALEATRIIPRDIKSTASAAEGTHKLGYEKPTLKKQQHPRRPSHNYQNTKARKAQGVPTTCNGCGGQHTRSECYFRHAKCNKCQKKGHIAKVC